MIEKMNITFSSSDKKNPPEPQFSEIPIIVITEPKEWYQQMLIFGQLRQFGQIIIFSNNIESNILIWLISPLII